MTNTIDYEKLSALAYLADSPDSKAILNESISAIMNFVDVLRKEDTNNIAPLFHPMSMHQRLREDAVSEDNESQALSEITALFEQDLYWVPKVLDAGQ